MEILVTIPDEVADHLIRQGREPARELLELTVVTALREGRIFESEAVQLLGMASRSQLWDWLKHVDPDGGYDTLESLKEQLNTLSAAERASHTL